MQTIGIRDLLKQTNDVLRRVREDGESFEITDEGWAVAHLVPARPLDASSVSHDEFWERWDRLTDEISAVWPAGVSAVDAVREQRRVL